VHTAEDARVDDFLHERVRCRVVVRHRVGHRCL
jgi:hypothetical protein